MENQYQNRNQPNNLVAVNVKMIGSKMSSKREVRTTIQIFSYLSNIDFPLPSDRM